MGKMAKLMEILSPNKSETQYLRIHMDDPLAVMKLSSTLTTNLINMQIKAPPIILCIGTDRSTGDSLGPLTGWRLSTLLKGSKAQVFGNVENPVHAKNLADFSEKIKTSYSQHPVIAVDACLGNTSNVGTIVLDRDSIKPGAGLKKSLPPVGDISVSGVVNVGGFMEFQVLQNTRLNIVLKMSHIISNSIFLAVQRIESINKKNSVD